MSTEQNAPSPVTGSRVSAIRAPSARPPAASKTPGRILRSILLVAVIGGIGYGAWTYAASMITGLGSASDHNWITQPVARGNLLITVTEDGNVESAANIDIKCQVFGGSTILWIIPDGTEVKKGEELVRLDASLIEDQINAQRIVFEKAQALRIAAEKEYSAAKIAVQEYSEGTYVKELQAAQVLITVAMENLRSSENSLEHTQRMARKGYVTPLQLDAQKFAVERARLDLETAQTTKKVLQDFTRKKMLEGLESLRDSAEARMHSEEAASDLEKARLERLKAQLENTTILAPQDGMVIYANERSMSMRGGSSQTVTIEEGATVREKQTIIRLPDLSQMQVKVNVHESKVDQLSPGLRARITIQGQHFQGEVISVANQPEPSSMFSASIKEYATVVRISGNSEGLKPGMTADVEILVSDLKNVLAVPVQAVVEQRGKFYAWVKVGDKVERRPLVIGATNNTKIEIKDGLSEGELVVLNPRAAVGEAREEPRDAKSSDGDAAKKFGTASGSVPPAAAKPAESRPKSSSTNRGSMMDLDANKDGKVTKDEAPEQMQQFFDRVDTNGDGGIDATEAAAAAARRRAMQQEAGEAAPGSSP